MICKDEGGGFWSEVPALSGCYSQGETIEETMENTKEAIEAHIIALKEDQQEIQAEMDFIIGKVSVTAI